MRPQDFNSVTPRFIPEEYFQGASKGQGVFYDRFGNVKARFVAELNGQWNGTVLTLNEVLTYDWGEKVQRTYTFTKKSEHLYEVTAPDLVGPGTVESYGNTLRWRYKLRQKIGKSFWTLSFNDWMFLQQDGVVLNRAYASKFGIGLGEVFMAVTKVNATYVAN